MPVSGVGCALSLQSTFLMRGTDRQDTLNRTLPNSTMPHKCYCWNPCAMVCVSHRPLWICRFSTIVLSCTIAKCKKGTNKEIRDMQTSPRSTASDKLALTLTGSRVDRQDTFKNPTYYHTKYYSNRLHNSGNIEIHTHSYQFLPSYCLRNDIDLDLNFDIRHKISDSYQLSTQGQPKISNANLIEPVLGIYNCNNFFTCLNAE